MAEFWSSFSKWFEEKANSPLYWTYFGFFVAWNWQFFQIIFLEDPSLFAGPRVEYLDTLLFAPFTNIIVNSVINTIWHIIPPVGFTYLAIVFLPTLHEWAFEIYWTHHFDRKVIFNRIKAQYERRITDYTKKEATARKERVEQEKIIAESKTQEEKWQDELDQIKRTDLLQKFQLLVSAIYEDGGMAYSSSIQRRLPGAAAIMAFAGTSGLIDVVVREGTSSLVTITEKGKYFSRALTEKGILPR